MSDKKYLYYNNRWHGLQRDEIVRETACFYFIENDRKVSKKTMYTGDAWNHTYYQEETPELKERYEKETAYKAMISGFHDKLDKFRKIVDPEIIKKVMEIEI